ncbi:hypothetical protein FRC06_008105 [Ceratobasidium sp. 370]|nr:hypothetical protein FRC06_008105 [Ceratobasidium sp. 370]
MLLAASPHVKDPATHDAPDTLPSGVLAPPALPGPSTTPGAGPPNKTINQTNPPAHAIHTPQQLAQLEAIAQAQTRSASESTAVSDEEKYLAAQLVYLASQHHGSEYNRQKVNQGPQSIYIPLSIQLPDHIRDLRVRQAQSTRRQAWFIAQRRDKPDNTLQIIVPSDSRTEGQVDATHKPTLFSQDQPTKEVLSTFRPASPRYDPERSGLVRLRSVQVSLLQDALGNSVLPSPPDASPSVAGSTKFSPITFSLLPTPVSRPPPNSTEVGVVHTPPPLPETALPQVPPPARSRPPSNSPPKLPSLSSSILPASWLVTPDDFGAASSGAMNHVLNGQPIFWPQPPTRPAPIHVAPIPTPQLQLALETAISGDLFLDPRRLHPSVNEQAPVGVFQPPGPNAGRAVLYGTPSNGIGAGGLPHPPVPPRLIALPKTSETHPINISQVVPPECMAMISSHLEKYPNDDPASKDDAREVHRPRGSYFRVTPPFRLDHVLYVLAVRAYEARVAMDHYSPVPVQARFMEGVARPRSGASTGPSLRPVASEPTFDRPPKRPFPMTPPVTPLAMPQPKRPGNLSLSRVVDTSNCLNLDLRNNGHESPDEESHKARSEPPTVRETPVESIAVVPQRTAHNEHLTSITLPTLPLALRAPPAPPLITPQQPSPSPIGAFPINQPPFPPSFPVSRPNSGGLTLGNLYMSSCPGKKVRLNGPVKGRGAICRDLGVDLARIKSIGVDLIVCCLDDDEMEFLGAPWPEYEDAASAVGLDVLRLPMPEGLCPLSVQAMSRHMDQIICDYTLAGRHVLVHCRGGVGRAGLVACAWMLKLGICGSVEPNDQVVEWDEDTQPPAERLMHDRRVAGDTLELLERVIYVIRRQRSVKAIETYEQVRFLLEFIEHVRHADAKASS